MIDLGQRLADRQAGSNHEPIAVVMVRLGLPLNLSDAALTFSMRAAEGGALVVDNGAAVGGANGVAQYAPTIAEVSGVGIYQCQFTATYPDSTVHRTPVLEMRVLPNV